MLEPNQSKSRINRRQFLGWSWFMLGVALAGQAGWAIFKFFQPRRKEGAFGDLVVAGRVEEFPPGTVEHVLKGNFYISNLEGVGLLAMWQRCTHLGCTVPWREVEDQFHCPCHSSLFDRAGVVTGGPAPRPLDLFPLEIVDGVVVVDTGKPIERQVFVPSQATEV